MLSIVRQLYMEKVIPEICHLSNHRVYTVGQYNQVVNGAKMLQQKSVDRIKYVLHRYVHRTVECPENVPVAHLQKNRVVMYVEVIHCETKLATQPINRKLIDDSLNERVHPE